MANFFTPLRALQHPNLGLGGIGPPDPPTAVPGPGQGIGPMRPQPTDMGFTPGGSLPAIGRPQDVTLPDAALGGDPGFMDQLAAFGENAGLAQELLGGNQGVRAPAVRVQQFQPPAPTFETPRVRLSDIIAGR